MTGPKVPSFGGIASLSPDCSILLPRHSTQCRFPIVPSIKAGEQTPRSPTEAPEIQLQQMSDANNAARPRYPESVCFQARGIPNPLENPLGITCMLQCQGICVLGKAPSSNITATHVFAPFGNLPRL